MNRCRCTLFAEQFCCLFCKNAHCNAPTREDINCIIQLLEKAVYLLLTVGHYFVTAMLVCLSWTYSANCRIKLSL